MHIHTRASLGVLVGTLLITAIYFAVRADRAAPATGASAGPATTIAADSAVEPAYCLRRTAGGVMVQTVSPCPPGGNEHGADSTRLTITLEDGHIILTGSDP